MSDENIEIYFLVYHVKPSLDNIQDNKYGGAYASCWIEAKNERQAMKIAENKIVQNHWIVFELDECFKAEKANYTKGSNQLEFYEQALMDKLVLTFHTYPIE